MQLSGDVLAAYLSIYGGVEQVTQVTSNSGTAYGDYVFIMCLDRGGFNNIPHIIKYRDQSMTVVVEGRKPLCWSCKKFDISPKPALKKQRPPQQRLLLLRLHLPSQSQPQQQHLLKSSKTTLTKKMRKGGPRLLRKRKKLPKKSNQQQ